MHRIDKFGGQDGRRWTIYPKDANDFLKLPSGDFIKPRLISAIRVANDSADRKTGEISARVHICQEGSWFSVKFDGKAEADDFAMALALAHEAVCVRMKSVSHQQANELVEQLGFKGSDHAAPGDLDDEEHEE